MPRVIPLLLHKEGRLVLSRGFSRHHDIGDALQIADRYKTWDLDELIYLDISSHWCATPADELMRRFVAAVGAVARFCFVPLAVGGGVRSLSDIDQLLHSGADRIVLNTTALDRPELVREAARLLGSQAVIASVDARRVENGEAMAFVGAGKRPTGRRAADWAKELEDLGAGEILINSIDRDGSGLGYDVELIESIVQAVSVPVIVCGGAGCWADFGVLLRQAKVSVAAANIFAFKELSYHAAKEAILADGVAIRPSILSRDYRADKKVAGSRLGADQEQIWIDLAKPGVD